MQIAFISDIHGNYDALKAVLKNIKKLRINKIYCLGDIVNYYYEPHKCINIFIKEKIESIKGNHENILFKILKDKKKINYYSKLYGNSININLKKLKKKHINFLKNLKNNKIIKINDEKIFLAHGAPWKSDFYFYPNSKKKWIKKISEYNYNKIILGHTHYPMKKSLGPNKMLLNPGSVGQPRNGKCNASWLRLDVNTMKFSHMETKYDKTKIKKQISIYDSNNMLLLKYFNKCK